MLILAIQLLKYCIVLQRIKARLWKSRSELVCWEGFGIRDSSCLYKTQLVQDKTSREAFNFANQEAKFYIILVQYLGLASFDTLRY